MHFVSGFVAVAIGAAVSSASADIPRLNLSLSTLDDSFEHTDESPFDLFLGWNFTDKVDGSMADLGYSVSTSNSLDSLVFGFNVVNTTSALQTYILEADLPVGPYFGDTFVGGSIGATVTDGNLDGNATLSSLGSRSLFQGFVDGAEALSLVESPFSLSAGFVGGTAVLTPESAGLPGLDSIYAGNQILDELSIRLTFTLTAGDSATFGGVFAAQTIPSPSGIAILGMFVLNRRRRRRE